MSQIHAQSVYQNAEKRVDGFSRSGSPLEKRRAGFRNLKGGLPMRADGEKADSNDEPGIIADEAGVTLR